MILIHHLNDSRSQRILWLLEELGLEYDIKRYERDSVTHLAPPELLHIHPLGKSPVIEDGNFIIHESGAIIDYLIRKYAGDLLHPTPESQAYEQYVQWLHYAEGSAMLPLLLKVYVDPLGDGGAALQPRINSELDNHLGFVEASLESKTFLLDELFSAADIQMSFVGEIAGSFGLLHQRPNLTAWIKRLQARPAYQSALTRGGTYRFVVV
ncbi:MULTISPECIES: glutathione S-transferase family protein [Providencia]|uniref:glutathione transferase n=1 Tax=Providencia rustigianii DSM 4541 TaxID=500637 RepID=D1P3H9_9GAMM|nr:MULTISPECIES: glutathione S-transferase [Providencia]EFB72095.1 glutathione S-transferase, N-terminal domain protein [Providencia rustigianii DSM 4541]SPY78216.1 Glutathione S-transferase GST-6.0 [Providencia rustigianii]SUC27836.1 Glutathione S-transferase GST-6.0 [Providencia rustigianii]